MKASQFVGPPRGSTCETAEVCKGSLRRGRRSRVGPRGQALRRSNFRSLWPTSVESMDRVVAAPPSFTCIQDSVLSPAHPVLRYTIAWTLMKPRAPMRVLVVAVERPPSEYLEFHRELGAGAMEVLDCHSDPHGWASPDLATGEPGIVHGDEDRDGSPARPLCCRLDPTDGFAALVAGARKLAGGERALLVIDSVNPLLAAGQRLAMPPAPTSPPHPASSRCAAERVLSGSDGWQEGFLRQRGLCGRSPRRWARSCSWYTRTSRRRAQQRTLHTSPTR